MTARKADRQSIIPLNFGDQGGRSSSRRSESTENIQTTCSGVALYGRAFLHF